MVTEGVQATFTVEFEGCPVPSVKWLRYTFPLSCNEDIDISTLPSSSTLTIKNTCQDDSGIFTCVLENKEGSTKSSTNLAVVEKTEMMIKNNAEESKVEQSVSQKKMSTSMSSSSSSYSATKQMIQSSSSEQVSSSAKTVQSNMATTQSNTKIMKVKKGDKIRIDIQFKDGSRSDLTFTHNGKNVDDSKEKDVNVVFENDIARLIIANADVNHSGKYECIMKTEGGEARCSVECLVE